MTFKPSHVHIGTDHAAFELKEYLVGKLTEAGYQVVDHGAASYDSQDDYPDYCIPCAQAVMADPGSLGIVLGGSGNGEQIAANKVRGFAPHWRTPSRSRNWHVSTTMRTLSLWVAGCRLRRKPGRSSKLS